MTTLTSFLVLTVTFQTPVDQTAAVTRPDPLSSLRVLEGTWQGDGEGFGQKSKVTHEWKRVLGGKFLRLKTRSVTQGKDGKESVHEDVGYVSFSRDENVLRFRQFLSEGFVNSYRIVGVAKHARGFNFEPESTEGYPKMAARLTLRFDRDGSGYEMVLELGSKGKELKPCQHMKLTKVKATKKP